jgi:hypothetical protein
MKGFLDGCCVVVLVAVVVVVVMLAMSMTQKMDSSGVLVGS